MGAEAEHPQQLPPSSLREAAAAAPAVLGLQLSALVDHVACVDWSLLNRVPGDRGGSQQVLRAPPSPSLGALLVIHFNSSKRTRPFNSQIETASPILPCNG